MALNPQDNVASNWSVLVDEFDTSGTEFFKRVKLAVEAREVPEVSFERILHHESGALSDKRLYLRIKRRDLLFDIGAAPYGTSYFFSWWLVKRGARFAWLYTLGFFALWFGIAFLFAGDGVIYLGLLVGLFIAVVVLMGMGRGQLLGPEEHILQAPLIGGLYRRFISPDTYHSLDLLAMYQESIRRAINTAIDETLLESGRAALLPEQKQLSSGGMGGSIVPVLPVARPGVPPLPSSEEEDALSAGD